MGSTSIAWLRNDLRLTDNPALLAATRSGETAIALYIHEQTEGVRPPGAAARWWLHQSLVALAEDLAGHGIGLIVRSGATPSVMDAVIAETGASAVFWNRRYAPGERAIDEGIKRDLRDRGLVAESFGANVLFEPWEIETGQGKPYSVFTPFWNRFKTSQIEKPAPPPEARSAIAVQAANSGYEEPAWADKLASHWTVGEAAAQAALVAFLDSAVADYPARRDVPAADGTSRLSPHLRFGEISPTQIWHAASAMAHAEPDRRGATDKFLSELAWREFSYHQLYHRDEIAEKPMQPKYERMAWRHAPVDLRAWQKGRTGIPIVDAGMRELWETGYMQNRVRMLVASLLTKNMLIDWRLGEQWFWDCLVDGDVANNPASWQWVAGCGLDAAPYFRIFNPVVQGERFDGDGAYVRRWVPEIAALPDKWIHRPSEAPDEVLAAADVDLGQAYPLPIVELKHSRQRALDALSALSEE